jgi:hypothetical protein
MGLVLVGVVAGMLIGYALAPAQASLQQCGSQICFDASAPIQPAEAKSTTFTPDPVTRKAKSVAAAKPRKQSRPKSVTRIDVVKNTHPPAGIEAGASHRSAETSDPVLNKARISVGAKLENPASAEFGDMRRAIRKNTFGRPVDTICGHVRGKNASGADTGEKPFLYLVKEDDAYVVDGKADSAAAIAYRNICT